jgi:hypothetical protein
MGGNKMKHLHLRRLLAISQLIFPGFSCCKRCWRTWNICQAHYVDIPETSWGIFALCESCNKELSLIQKQAYYFKLYANGRWQKHTYNQIRKAVEKDHMEGN